MVKSPSPDQSALREQGDAAPSFVQTPQEHSPSSLPPSPPEAGDTP